MTEHSRKSSSSIKVHLDVAAVAALIREVADDVIMPRWRNLAAHEIGTKSKAGDIVTIADHEAEAALAKRLCAMLPGSVVVGEEGVAANPGLLAAFDGDAPVWVVDPIDGTRKFAAGDPAFDVLVGLVVGGRPIAGWIYAPAERAMILGEAGSGVVIEDSSGERRLVARDAARELRDLSGIVSGGGFASRGYADPKGVGGHFREFTRHACAGHNYARLLRGESDFLINFSTLPWDHMAGLALAAEAGFHAARHDGRAFDPQDSKGGLLVAPDPDSWHSILALLLRPA